MSDRSYVIDKMISAKRIAARIETLAREIEELVIGDDADRIELLDHRALKAGDLVEITGRLYTGRDAVQVIANGGDPAKVHLSEVMTAKPDTIEPERKAIDALHMMCDGGYRHLPVVVDGKVVGIVSRSDFKGLELDQFEDEQSLWERIC